MGSAMTLPTIFSPLRHNDWSNVPREPISAAFAAVAAGTATFGQWAIFIATNVAISYATSQVIGALTPRPKLNGSLTSLGSSGTLVNSTGALDPAQFVYGEMRKGGSRVIVDNSGGSNKILHMCIVLAGHEVHSIDDVYLNDQIVTLDANGYVTDDQWQLSNNGPAIRILKHRGNQRSATDNFQNASTSLRDTLHAEAPNVPESSIGKDIAYIYARMEYDQSTFASGIPLITAKIRGKKVFNPLTDTTEYTANAAACIRDFIVSEYGLNDTGIDETYFYTAADVCDDDVALGTGGTEKRYEINGTFSSDETFFDVLQKMMTACGGTLYHGEGKWKLRVSNYTNPVKTLTLGDLRSPIGVQPKQRARDSFNTVRGTFIDKSQDYVSADFPPVSGSEFINNDNGKESVIDLELPFTTSSASAQRLAKLTLYRQREEITVACEFSMAAAFDLEVGDIIRFPVSRYGWDNVETQPNGKEFEVQRWKLYADEQTREIKIAVSLREISQAALDWQAEETAITRNNTSLLRYYDAPSIGFDLINTKAVPKVLNEKLVNQLDVVVTSNSPQQVARVEIQYRLANQTPEDAWTLLGVGPVGRYSVVDVSRDFYDIRVRAINGFGYAGEYEYLYNFEVDALSAPPADVTGFEHEISSGTIFLSWDAVPDLDLSYYQIRYTPLTSGFTWGSAQVAVSRVARPATTVTVPARSGTWLIKAYDKNGNESVNLTSNIILPSELPALNTSDVVTEDPTFAGTKTNTVIDTAPAPDELIISNRTSATSNTGEYEFASQIDVGTVRTGRVTGTVTFDRYYPDAGTWTKIHGNFLSWPDNFTTWTDEQANFSDHTVQIYAAASDDNSTWGAWTLANGQQIVGRYFKFKAVLSSTNLNVSPAIKTLSAEVAY